MKSCVHLLCLGATYAGASDDPNRTLVSFVLKGKMRPSKEMLCQQFAFSLPYLQRVPLFK